MNFRAHVFIFMMLFSPWAVAGGVDVSGGGHGVDDGDQVYLLDLAERGVQKENPTFGQFEERIGKAVQADLVHLKDLIADQKSLLGLLHELFEVSDLLGNAVLKTIALYSWVQVDQELELVPVHSVFKNEELAQVAVRKGKTVHINRELWLKMNGSNQAALVVHEALHALSHACPESRARQVLGALYSGELKRMEPLAREDFISECLPAQGAIKKHIYQYFLQAQETEEQKNNKINGMGILVAELKLRDWMPLMREWRIHPQTGKLMVVVLPHFQIWNSRLGTLTGVKSIRSEADRQWADGICGPLDARDKSNDLLVENVFYSDLFFSSQELQPVVEWKTFVHMTSYSRSVPPRSDEGSCWGPKQAGEEELGPIVRIQP